MVWPPTTHGDMEDVVGILRLASFNVRDFGAVGDGVADDTAAIQAAIDAASGGPAGAEPSPLRVAVGRVYFPAGSYKTTTAPLCKAVLGLTLFGDGARASIILVSGTRTSGVNAIGCPNIVMADLGINGDGYAGSAQVTTGLAVDWTPAQAATWGTPTTLHRVYVENLKFVNGMTFGASSGVSDLAEVHAYDCTVGGNRALTSDDSTGLWQYAYVSGNGTAGNVLNHHYTHCTATSVRRMLRQNNVNLVTMDKCSGSFLDAAIYRSGVGTTVFRNARIEDSRRLAVSTGQAGYEWNLTLDDVVWSPAGNGATDRMIVQWWGPGNVRLRQLVLEEASSGVAPWLFQFNTSSVSTWQVNVVVDGIVCPNTTAESLFSVPTGTKVFADVRGLIAYDNAVGVTGTVVNHKTLVFNGATADSGSVDVTT